MNNLNLSLRPDRATSLGPYVVAAKGHWVSRAIRAEELGGKRNDFPILLYLYGATGAGKTELGQLYAREQGISYDADRLAQKAGIEVDFTQLRNELRLDPKQSIHVLSLPKYTTRDPRPTETSGIDSYFVTPQIFEQLRQEGRMTVIYQYPKEGAWYGVPTSVSYPLKSGRDGLITMTGHDAFKKMATEFPDAVGIWVDAASRDIEAHIKGRAASEGERKSRLDSFAKDRQDFYEHRNEIDYSVFIDSLSALRRDITPDRVGQLLREMDDPLRQIKAIVRFEGLLRRQGIKLPSDPQAKFDYFLDHSVRLLFNGMEYRELEDRIKRGQYVPVFDKRADNDLLEKYTLDKGISRALLDNLVESIQVNAVFEANGRRSIVLSPYSIEYISAVGGTGKRVVLDLLARKMNGTGAHLVHEDITLVNQSFLSALESKFYHLDEGLYVTLSSDHMPVRELGNKARALNILFSDALPEKAMTAIKPMKLEEAVNINARLARVEKQRRIFQRATQP